MTPPTFIEPCLPTLQAVPPLGPLWTCEVKFDGYRVQLRKHAGDAHVFSRRGADFSKRAGRQVAEAIRRLPSAQTIRPRIVPEPNGLSCLRQFTRHGVRSGSRADRR